MGGGIFGVEFDLGYSPNFFGVSNPNATINLIGDGNVTTAMGNLILGAPLGPVRPYAVRRSRAHCHQGGQRDTVLQQHLIG